MKRTKATTEIRTRKLQLDREVVRALQTHRLVDIVGGIVQPSPTQVTGPPRVCCA